jgi:hypothetical protein
MIFERNFHRPSALGLPRLICCAYLPQSLIFKAFFRPSLLLLDGSLRVKECLLQL